MLKKQRKVTSSGLASDHKVKSMRTHTKHNDEGNFGYMASKITYNEHGLPAIERSKKFQNWRQIFFAIETLNTFFHFHFPLGNSLQYSTKMQI